MRALPSSATLGLAALLALGFSSCGDDKDNVTAASALAITCVAVPASGSAPLHVAFATVTNAGPPIDINYGDGTTGNDPMSGHIYANPGSYGFTMTVHGSGQSASCNGTITVSALPPGPPNRPPVLRIHVFPKPPVGAIPLDVTLTGCSSTDPDGDKVHFNWDFGDGSQATGECRRVHTYNKRGTFHAQVCGSDGQPDHVGCAAFTVQAF